MNESLYKYMKPGLVHFMAYPATMKGEGPVVETIKKVILDAITRISQNALQPQRADFVID